MNKFFQVLFGLNWISYLLFFILGLRTIEEYYIYILLIIVCICFILLHALLFIHIPKTKIVKVFSILSLILLLWNIFFYAVTKGWFLDVPPNSEQMEGMYYFWLLYPMGAMIVILPLGIASFIQVLKYRKS